MVDAEVVKFFPTKDFEGFLKAEIEYTPEDPTDGFIVTDGVYVTHNAEGKQIFLVHDYSGKSEIYRDENGGLHDRRDSAIDVGRESIKAIHAMTRFKKEETDV